MLLDRAWPQTAAAIERPELVADERFDTYRKRAADNARELVAILDDAFATAPAAEWVRRLNDAGMFAAPVQDYADIAQDAQIAANGYISEVPHPGRDPVRIVATGISIDGAPVHIQRLAPQLGEHTEEVLLDAGYTWEDIIGLRDAGAIGPPDARA